MTNDHSVGGDQGRRFHSADDTDAALSLCDLGRPRSHESRQQDAQFFKDIKAFHSFKDIKAFHSLSIKLPAHNTLQYTVIVSPIARSPVSQTVVQNLTPSYSLLEMRHSILDKSAGHNILALLPKKSQATKQRKTAALPRKNNMKPKDPKRDTSVSFEEMKRIMRVYGPIKALRSRAVKDTGTEAKPESIRRKFYRWFPDFAERFVKTSDGWFTPKAGHQQEMDYREAMREMDKQDMAKKRVDTRYNCNIIRNMDGMQTLYH